MQKNQDRSIQHALALDRPEPEESHQGVPSGVSSANPTPTDAARLSRHPLSLACGDLPPAACEALIKRAEQSGSVRTIPTLDGLILLDWELYNIALDLGLTVELEEFQGHDPVAFIVLHHLRQHHWDHGQRAVIAVRLYAWRKSGRPEKPDGPNPTPEVPATTAEMAEAALVSPTFITRAKRVHELGLSEAVIAGDLKFADAYRRVRLVLDAGLVEAVTRGAEDFADAHSRAQVVADAGLLKLVRANECDFDAAYRMALAGETGERELVRPRPLTKAELTRRVADLEAENRALVQNIQTGSPEHGSTVVRYQQQLRSLQSELGQAEARAGAAQAEVNRLTALLRHSEIAA